MRARTTSGPGCPACNSGSWTFDDPASHFHREDDIPLPEVTVEATCDCGAAFYLDLSLADDSVWRGPAVPRDWGPLEGFGWLDDTLHAWGRRDDDGQYHEQYRLAELWTL